MATRAWEVEGSARQAEGQASRKVVSRCERVLLVARTYQLQAVSVVGLLAVVLFILIGD